MKEIYFYNGTELKYAVWANTIEDVINTPFSYYPNYTEDMVISSIKYQYPTLENGNLRELTREELVEKGIEIVLEDGEKIKNKKLIKIERPSKWHTWNGNEWTVDIEEVKKAKREELKAIREEKISENLIVNGDEFQVKEKDLQNFYNLKIVVDLDSSKANEKINWVLADNRIKEFSYSELMNVLTTYILRKQDIFTQFGKISIILESLKTVEKIENLKWS